MNNIIQTIRHTARAATVLLLALLAAQTAGAQGAIRADFNMKSVTADGVAVQVDGEVVVERW